MKISIRQFFASLFVLSLFLSAGQALAWPPDNMPHIWDEQWMYCSFADRDTFGDKLYTFRLCVGTSQATTWSWTFVRRSDNFCATPAVSLTNQSALTLCNAMASQLVLIL